MPRSPRPRAGKARAAPTSFEDSELTFKWQAATITMDVEMQPDGSLVFTNVVDQGYQALSDVQFGLHPWAPIN